MPTKLKPVDVAIVGVGLTGTIIAKELAEAGLKVLGLERGRWRDTDPDFAMPYVHDELRYVGRHELMQDLSRETITFRNNAAETALPMRQLGSFRPGEGVGGAAVHWGGLTWRFLPWDFETRSRTLARYGKGQLAEDCTSQDWGVTYDELERHFDRFEYLYGISGKAGNLRGRIVPGGNPFEGPRSREYPNPPLKTSYAGALFTQAAEKMGYKPFPTPTGALSRAYTNEYGATINACVYCGYCQFFGCEMGAKASPQTAVLPNLMKQKNFELRTHANVTKVDLDAARKRAIGVTYVDSRGREFEQPAEMVLLCSYVLNNVRLMLLSGIGKPYDPAANTGVVGRNYAYQTPSSVTLFFEDRVFNQFMAAGGMGMTIDEFNGDNFDHSGLGFIGGGFFQAATSGSRPIDGGDLLQPLLPDHHPGGLPELPRQLPRSGPDVSRCVRPAVAAHDLRSPRERAQDVAVAHRQGGADRQGDRPVEDERRPAHREVHHRPLPEHAQHGRRDHGSRPREQRGQQVSAKLGRAERLRGRRERVSAERRLQPDGDCRRPRLLDAGRDQEPLPEASRPARRLALSRRNTRPTRWCPSAAGRRRSSRACAA